MSERITQKKICEIYCIFLSHALKELNPCQAIEWAEEKAEQAIERAELLVEKFHRIYEEDEA